MSEWTSVKDRLPAPWKDNPHCSELVLMLMWDKRMVVDRIWFWEIEDAPIARITHWMPLPEPPK